MPGALEALAEVLARVDSGGATAAEAIEELLAAQIALRNSRRLATAMRSNRLPALKTLEEYDFAFQPSVKREQASAVGRRLRRRRDGTVTRTGGRHPAAAVGGVVDPAGPARWRRCGPRRVRMAHGNRSASFVAVHGPGWSPSGNAPPGSRLRSLRSLRSGPRKCAVFDGEGCAVFGSR